MHLICKRKSSRTSVGEIQDAYLQGHVCYFVFCVRVCLRSLFSLSLSSPAPCLDQPDQNRRAQRPIKPRVTQPRSTDAGGASQPAAQPKSKRIEIPSSTRRPRAAAALPSSLPLVPSAAEEHAHDGCRREHQREGEENQ